MGAGQGRKTGVYWRLGGPLNYSEQGLFESGKVGPAQAGFRQKRRENRLSQVLANYSPNLTNVGRFV
jgi:hypothetical protein